MRSVYSRFFAGTSSMKKSVSCPEKVSVALPRFFVHFS